ncbi:MAG: hypothetical protein ACFFB2_00780 [Promethearchaeota archaeon]
MENEIDFSVFIQEPIRSKSTTEQEALALAIGLNPQLKNKFKIKQLKEAGNSQDLIIKRASLIGLGFSAHQDPNGGIEQYKILKSFLNDPLTTTRMTASIALGMSAFFSKNRKFKKKCYNEFRKKIKKADLVVKYGYALGLGLLAKYQETQKGSLAAILEAYNPVEMESPDSYLIGLTLSAINNGRTEEVFDFIMETVIPALSNKESKRIAVICNAFLLPLIPDPSIRMKKLEDMIRKEIEFHSKFGTDSAVVLTFFSLQDEKQKENFFLRLIGLKDLDSDYNQIFSILKENKKAVDILRSLLGCNTLDIKAAGITASYFLESEEFIAELGVVIKEVLQQRPSGYFDRFLVLLRTFSYILMSKDYSHVKDLESFFHSNDQRIKRFAGLSYSCLKAIQQEFQDVYYRLRNELDENIRWGLLIGVSLYEYIGHNPLDDELILGLLLLCLGFIDISTLLLISQAMVSKFYH